MNNKCGCDAGCQAGSAFVPVNSNWDFNMDGNGPRQRQKRCNASETAGTTGRHTCQTECAERSAGPRNACTGRADCPCETCVLRREAERSACRQTACTCQADCPCETCSSLRREAGYNNCGKQKGKADNRGVGIVWAKAQEIDEVYDCGRALKAGTLYPELHKPMDGYYPCDEDCGDRCQQIAFAMWELRLYLNTHPCDQEALAMLHKLQTACCEPNYATTFLEDVTCTDGTRNPAWRWTRDPWPWEYEANRGC